MFNLNLLDIILLVLLSLCGLAGYKRGLLRTVFGFVSFILALLITGFLFNPLTVLLRQTPLFTWLKGGISSALNLEEIYGQVGQTLIDIISINDFVRETLHANNTTNMYYALGVSRLPDYVAAFFANLILAAIAIVFLFVTSLVVLSFVGVAIDVVGRLPVISTFNHVGGLLIGFAFGVLTIVFGLFVMTLVFSSGYDSVVQDMLNGSMITQYVQENFFPRLFGRVV